MRDHLEKKMDRKNQTKFIHSSITITNNTLAYLFPEFFHAYMF